MTLVVVLLTIAIKAPVLYGQEVDIASDLDTAGRNFSCTGEVVIYTCSGQGNLLTINSPPLFTPHIFSSIDPVPDAVSTVPNVILTLTNRVINASGTFYVANMQITVLNDAQIDVSCSTSATNNVALPLIHESGTIEPPSNVTFSGDRTLSWAPPLNPLFDIDYYLVNIYVDGVLNMTRSSRDNGLDIKLPSGEITADVRIVTTCGSISAAQQSVGVVPIAESTDVTVVVPEADDQGLIVAIVILTILIVFSWIVVVVLVFCFHVTKLKSKRSSKNSQAELKL